jgi:predicted aminopeptidase
MRVYVPSTIPELAAILRTGQVRAGVAYAVTPVLREAYASGDTEELEYVALIAAARASLRLLADDPAAPPRRVVLAADVYDDRVTWTGQQPGADPASVTVTTPIPTAKLVSAHIDDAGAAQDIQQAVAALPAADAGDADAEFEVDQAEGHELGWYATQELPDLLR